MDFGFLRRTVNVILRSSRSVVAECSSLHAMQSHNFSDSRVSTLSADANRTSNRSLVIPMFASTGKGGLASPLIQSDMEMGSPLALADKQSESSPRPLTGQNNSRNSKFWIHSCDVPACIAALTEHLSVVLDGNGQNCFNSLSTVYLDNTQRQGYTDRLLTGGKIFRLRTFNDDLSKIALEKCSDLATSADRLVLREEQVMPLLHSQKVPVSSTSEEALMEEFRATARDKRLYPVMRVDCDRVVLQAADEHGGGAGTRVTVDTNIRFLQERASHLEWRTASDRFLAQDEIRFPFAVVEICVGEQWFASPPKWLQDLVANPMMHRENKFSKYIHANFAFQSAQGNPLNLRQPVWWDTMDIIVPAPAAPPLNNISAPVAAPEKSPSDGMWSSLMALFSSSDAAVLSGKVVKVEPKTLFAMERTFLAWLSPALFVSSFGVAIMSDGDPTSGIILVAVGIVLISYALTIYSGRSRHLMQRRASGYYDQWGPALVSSVAIAAFIIALSVRAHP